MQLLAPWSRTVLLGVCCLALLGVAEAKPLRWAGAGELVSCDPHTATDTAAGVLMRHIYERLVGRDAKFALEPQLAESWERLTPTSMRFKLRSDVKFHDGTPFSANDVVFSLARNKQPTSLAKSNSIGIERAVRVDDLTVDIFTDKPLPTLLNQLALLPIMSHAWARKHGVEAPQNFAGGKENFATRNANGTGPYKLKSFESGGKVVFEQNAAWWGKPEGNVTEATYIPIKSNATRLAALLSGEVDLLIDPPVQDLARLQNEGTLKLLRIPEGRIILLAFDLLRDELLFSNVKGKNPFKDKRVREAVRLSIDSATLHRKVMRGHSLPTGSLTAQGIHGYAQAPARPAPFDPVRGRQLLAEAGYPNGFSVTLDCTNDRYILDEQICTAIAGMAAKVGIQIQTNPRPKAIFFQKTESSVRETSFFLVGMYSITQDALSVLDGLLHTFVGGTRGDNNTSGYSSAAMDALLDAALVEMDDSKRLALIEQVLLLQNQEVVYIPLHQQLPSWAMRRNIDTPARPDNGLDVKYVTIR